MSTSGQHTRSRHTRSNGSALGAGGVPSRLSHGSEGFDPRPSDPLYGSQMDTEMLDAVDIPAEVIDGSTHILDGSIALLESFAEDLRPVKVVAVLPTLPHVLYPEGATVVLTTDGKLYRNYGDAWVSSVGAVDGGIESVAVLPTLPHADYPVGSVVYLETDGKLYRNFGDTWTRATDGSDITPESITADQIQAGAIEAAHMSANSVTAQAIAANAVTAAKIEADAITSAKVAAGAISADKLAATLVLASLIKTAESGRRVEIDGAGIRLYASDGTTLVNIPTNTDPVYVAGDIDASSLISRLSAQFRGSVLLAAGSSTELEGTFTTPSTLPVLLQDVPTFALGSTPTNPGRGLSYDSAGGAGGATPSYWVGGNPTSTDDIAYEYNASTGALMRTLQKTGSIVVNTTTYGATTHESDSAEAAEGSGDSQMGVLFTMPSSGSNQKITKVAAWLAGYNGSANCKNAIWSSSGGTLHRSSAAYTAADKAFANGNSVLYNKSLTSSLAVSGGTQYIMGFLHTSGSEGFQWDKDHTGSTKRGDGLDGAYSGINTESGKKPNVYITYTYETDTSLEGAIAEIIGVCRASTYVWVLDINGILYQYDQNDLEYVAKFDISASISGTKSKAGLFFDSPNSNLVVITTTGTGAGVQLKFVNVNESTGAVGSSLTATGAKTVSGSAATLRGGYNDGTSYWIAVDDAGGTGVYAWLDSTGAYSADHDFGAASEMASGVTWNGSEFVGWGSSRGTTLYKFTGWDWTTASAIYWVGYTWYDSAGTTHETPISARASITMDRRHRLSVTVPSLPGSGGADEPNNVRVYMLPNASNPSPGSFKLQSTANQTVFLLTTYNSGGAADGGTPFAGGTPAEIVSPTSLRLAADGTLNLALVSELAGSTTEGDVRWDDTRRSLYAGDSVRARPVTPVGYVPFMFPPGIDWSTPLSSNITMAAGASSTGGSVMYPIHLPAPMLLQQLWVYSNEASLARTGEWRLYYERLGDSSTINEVPNANGTFSYTAAGAEWKSSAAQSPPVLLPPGTYWVVLHNTHATNTWVIGVVAGGLTSSPSTCRVDAAGSALGSTLDTTQFSANNNRTLQIALHGRVFNEGAAF